MAAKLKWVSTESYPCENGADMQGTARSAYDVVRTERLCFGQLGVHMMLCERSGDAWGSTDN